MTVTTIPHADFIDFAPETDSFEQAVIAGLHADTKAVSAKFLYDEEGSHLFEDICEQPEYYPTRTELKLLRDKIPGMATLIGPNATLVEFGAGALEKIRILLDGLDKPAGYIALDISGDHLKSAADSLAADYPDIPVTAICADYTRPMTLPSRLIDKKKGRLVGFFPGSTIGNFSPDEAKDFLKTIRPMFLPDGLLIIGVDLKKDPSILNAAYNDKAGITAAFNLNLLKRINNELSGEFDLTQFAHKAFYNEKAGRVEMHLESLKDQTISVADQTVAFHKGETIHTEISCKYTIEEFQTLAQSAGWSSVAAYHDKQALFSLHVLQPF